MPPPPPDSLKSLSSAIFKSAMAARASSLSKPTFKSAVLGFYHAVTWSEPWVVGLLTFHACLAVLVIASRHLPTLQGALFLALCGGVLAAPTLNSLGASHWAAAGFSQDYFDDRGVFVSFFYSLPLLALASFQMLYAFTTSVRLLIKVKRAELARGRAAAGGKPAGGDAPAPPVAGTPRGKADKGKKKGE